MLNCTYLFAQIIPQNLYYILFAFGAGLIFTTLFRRFHKKTDRFLIFLILLGTALNFVDRVGDGCVTDPFNFFNLYYFNIPDLLITTGVLTLIVRMFINEANGVSTPKITN